VLAAPLFRDQAERNIIPQVRTDRFNLDLVCSHSLLPCRDAVAIIQVPLFDLLAKFDGITQEMMPDGTRKRYSLLSILLRSACI
jgi:hypothetical protein